MESVNSKLLQSIIAENKKEMEGLFPELIKRLILSSCKRISAIRIPSLDDVWAPGFDGILTSDEQSTYVNSGNSVWEFGTNGDSLKKISDDFKKRDEDSLGVNKKETSFYLVIPYVWAYNNQGVSITQWEEEHKGDWKSVKVYDAPIICEWINSEPNVCAWLFDKVNRDNIHDFSTVSSAWKNISNYTEPAFSYSMFLSERECEVEEFYKKIKLPLCVVSADTFVGARGFALAALMQNEELAQACLVVNNEKTYKSISKIINDKLILLNFHYTGEILPGNNIILCKNREGAKNKDEIELPLLTKGAYKKALSDMKIQPALCEELFAFTHGNLRTLIRRIGGSYVEERPDWDRCENKDGIVPLVLLRAINRKEDVSLVEHITGTSFSEIEKQYESLLKMEDSPIKKVNDNYVIVNFEEAWEILNLSVSERYFEKLTDTICEILESVIKQERVVVNRRFDRKMSALFLNYIYFSSCMSDEMMESAIKRFVTYVYEERTKHILIENLPVLAEAYPKAVLRFLNEDKQKKESVILSCFANTEYSHDYCYILRALEELMLVKETIVGAFKVLVYLYDMEYEYTVSNKPEDSLLSSLCLWRNEGTSSILQKKELMMSLLEQKKENYAFLAIKLINQDSYAVGVRLGERRVRGDSITVAELNSVRDEILNKVLDIAYEYNNGKLIKEMLDKFFFVTPQKLDECAERFEKEKFECERVHDINYWAREKLFSIKRFNWEEYEAYIAPIEKWIEKTTDVDEVDAAYWIYRNSYDCPALELLEDCDNYRVVDSARKSFQRANFVYLAKKYGKKILEKLIKYMSDDAVWGKIIAEEIDAEKFDYCVRIISEENKIRILCSFLDNTDQEQMVKYVHSCELEKRRDILSGLTNVDILATLTNEEDIKAYWKNKEMYEYDDMMYTSLLRYYPSNLILFLSINIEKNPEQYIDMAEDILGALAKIGEVENRRNFEYDLEKIMRTVDSVFYSEEWANICLKMYAEEIVNVIAESARKYLFDHPDIIKMLLDEGKVSNYRFLHDYQLPENAYLNYSDFKFFFSKISELFDENPEYYIGGILGKTKKGTDEWFPHEYVRNILEEFNSKELDVHVVVSYHNAQSFRLVSDGSDQKNIMEKYKNKALDLEVRYPHTAYILTKLSDEYGRNAKYDYEDSEINLF